VSGNSRLCHLHRPSWPGLAITADQLASVVGVAWGEGGRPGRLGLVNVAVGLRPVEVTRVIGEQQAKLTAASDEIASLRAELGTVQASLSELKNVAAEIGALRAAMKSIDAKLTAARSTKMASTLDK